MATAPPEFILSRDRDATAAIRGFVYQVDLTILRWLELEDTVFLELEFGEDIDRVARALTATGSGPERLLEQVKLRSKRLTLRSGEALEMLVNACEHRASNPSVGLLFRFSTNADIGRERRHPHPAWPEGLRIWHSVRRGGATAPERAQALTVIAEILRGAKRPVDVGESRWALLQSTVSNTEELEKLVLALEWITRGPSLETLQRSILERLIALELASSAEAAEETYRRMFVRVFRLLSSAGRKILSAQDARTEAERGGFRVEDAPLVPIVLPLIAGLSLRVDAVEETIQSLSTQMRELAQRSGRSADLKRPPAPDLEPPPLVSRLLDRAEAVDALLGAARGTHWVALRGERGIGKSHLAQLMARRAGQSPTWIVLRGSNGDSAVERIRTSLLHHAAEDLSNVRGAYEAAADKCATCLVLDDLPRLLDDSPLAHELLSLASALSKVSKRLISTSNHRLPSGLLERLASGSVQEVDAPRYTDDEVVQVFRAHGGDNAAMQPALVAILAERAHRHPTLIAAMAQHLRKREWVIDADALAALSSHDYAEATNASTLAHLLRESPERRELLLRLKLSRQPFSRAEVDAVAAVPPALGDPFATLEQLVDVWVQRDRRGAMRISPLVEALPSRQLSDTTTRQCHDALASCFSGRALDPDEAVQLISHLEASGEVERAAATLATFLDSLLRQHSEVFYGALLHLWWDGPFPPGVSRGARILLRTLQLEAGERFGRPTNKLQADLEAELSSASKPDEWAVVASGVRRFLSRRTTDPSEAIEHLRRAVDAASRAIAPDGKPLSFVGNAGLTPLVWTAVTCVRDREALKVFLDILDRLPNDARSWSVADLSAHNACALLVDGFWMREQRKPAANQRWSTVLETLGQLIEWARKRGWDVLWASSVRAKIAVLCEIVERFDEGLELGREAGLQTSSPDIRAMLDEALGRQLVHRGDYEQALPLLCGVLDRRDSIEPLVAILAANYAARAAAHCAPTDARAFLETAVALARRDPRTPVGEVARTLGELAIRLAHEGDSRGALEKFCEAAELLLEAGDTSTSWRPAAVGLGRAILFVSSTVIAELGEKPTLENAQLPQQGYLYSMRYQDEDYPPDFPVFISFTLCMFADAVGDRAKALRWAVSAMDHRTEQSSALVHTLALRVLPLLTFADRDDAAIALMDAVCGVVMAGRADPGRSKHPEWFDGPTGMPVVAGLVPAAIAIASAATQDRQAAQRLAEHAAGRLEALADGASDPRMWSLAARLLRAPFVGGVSAAEVRDTVSPELGSDYVFFHRVAWVLTSCCCAPDLRAALWVQAAQVPSLWETPDPLLSRAMTRAFAGWLEGYWISAAATRGGEFGAPEELQKQLQRVAGLPDEERARGILRAVTESLEIELPARAAAWLLGNA